MVLRNSLSGVVFLNLVFTLRSVRERDRNYLSEEIEGGKMNVAATATAAMIATTTTTTSEAAAATTTEAATTAEATATTAETAVLIAEYSQRRFQTWLDLV